MIETCVNININLRDTLTQSAKRIGLSRNALTQMLFARVLKEKRLAGPTIFTRVKYQAADPAKEWKNIGINLSPDMFEKCMDMRKMLKMSVSFILSYAIRTYLNQVIAEFLSGTSIKSKTRDNCLPFYSIQSICNEEVEGFIISWIKNSKKPFSNP